MTKTFLKNLFRDIKKTFSRFLSIVIIIAVGVSFYAGVRATSPDMKMSADNYFRKNNFMDFKIVSTLGLTSEDISHLEKEKWAKKVQGSYSLDAVIEKDKKSLVVNVNSLSEEEGINKVRMVRGTLPQNNNEIVLEENFFNDYKFKLNDTIDLESGKESNIEEDLKNSEFKIVGTAKSPLYISRQRQLSSLGNGTVKGFVYILPEVFKSEVYTEIYIKANSKASENSLIDNEKYIEDMKNIENTLKDIGIGRSAARYGEVLKAAKDKINEAEDKLNSSKKEAENKFTEGYKELDSARDKLNKGKEELKNKEALYNKEIQKGKDQIEQGKSQLQAGEAKLADETKALENIKLEIAEARKNLDESEKGNLQTAEEISAAREELQTKEALIQQGEARIRAAYEELEVNKKKLAASELQLNKEKQQGLEKLNEGKKELAESEKKIEESAKTLSTEEENAKEEFKKGEKKIQESKDKLEEIKKPQWYVLGRNTNVGYETYRQDSDRIDNIGSIFPLIFFLVAALVSLTTMTRMVQENRIEIGVFKALGYSRIAIVAHYLIYALSASLMGSLIGISYGFKLFPPLIIKAYSSLYTIPEVVNPFNFKLALQGALLAVAFTTLAAVAATLEELREVPASLMRPKPPKSGKRILLERVTFLWKRLSFSSKVTARNIFRYKQRFFMTVIGIAACTGLMITGFGLKEGIIGSTKKQFNDIYKYDMLVTLPKTISDEDKNELKSNISKDSNIKSVLFTYSKNATVNKGKTGTEDVYVVVPEDKEAFNNYINLNSKGNRLNLDEGVIITEKLAHLMDKKPGDTIDITINDKVIKAEISAITEHYIGHYIYMSPSYYEKIYGEKVSYNGFYGLLESTTEDSQNSTSKELRNNSRIQSVSFKNNVKIDMNSSMESVNSVVLVLIVSAGALAFVVIYNLTNININERKRELATIKLLGFYDNELAAYIYRENIILTIIGSLVGIVTGILLTNLVITTTETNLIMFLRKISPVYFLYSVILTVLFSIIVNLAMYKRFDKIDMIESLKSPE